MIHRPDRGALVSQLGAQPVVADILDHDQLTQALATVRPDSVLHLASRIPTGGIRQSTAWATNDRIRREGTRHLLAAARAANVRSFVFASVALVYQGGQGWVQEGDLIFPYELIRSTLDGERQVLIAAEQGALHTMILRAGTIYGPDVWHTRQWVEYLRRGRLPLPGRGANFWSLLHADDAGQAFALAAEAGAASTVPTGTIINVADDEPVRTRDLLPFLADCLQARQPPSLPLWIIHLIAGTYAAWALAHSVRVRGIRARELLHFQPRYPTYRDGFPPVLAQMQGQQPNPRPA